MFPFTIAHPYAPRPSRARIASYDADSVAVEVLADDFSISRRTMAGSNTARGGRASPNGYSPTS
jgi:hypothetical protein